MGNDPLFISPWERRRRIESLLKFHDITWYELAKRMGQSQASVIKAFKVEPYHKRDLTSVQSIKRCARALSVSAGFLIDRKEIDHE